MIKIKRAYDKQQTADGTRILIDGLWPKGIDKKDGGITLWFRQVAPSPTLRKWFGNDPKKFSEFVARYEKEILPKKAFLARIKNIEQEKGTVTLLYGAKDHTYNNATALIQILNNYSAHKKYSS